MNTLREQIETGKRELQCARDRMQWLYLGGMKPYKDAWFTVQAIEERVHRLEMELQEQTV